MTLGGSGGAAGWSRVHIPQTKGGDLGLHPEPGCVPGGDGAALSHAGHSCDESVQSQHEIAHSTVFH